MDNRCGCARFVPILVAAILMTPLPLAAADYAQETERSWTDDMDKSALAISQLRARDAEPLLKHALTTAEKIDALHKFFSLSALGFWSYKMQDLSAAQTYCEQALKLASEGLSEDSSKQMAQSIAYKLFSIVAKEKRDNSNSEISNAEAKKHASELDRLRLKCPEYYMDVLRAVDERWQRKRRDSTSLPVVRFVVGQDGSILFIYLTASSGDQNIDDIALSSVTSIGKFSPPPKSAPNPLFVTISLRAMSPCPSN
jgi:hypothetical protein